MLIEPLDVPETVKCKTKSTWYILYRVLFLFTHKHFLKIPQKYCGFKMGTSDMNEDGFFTSLSANSLH